MLTFFDDGGRNDLLPLTYTRPCADLRLGILTIAEKWQKHLGIDAKVSYLTASYLSQKYPFIPSSEALYINGRLCPDADLVRAIKHLAVGSVLKKGALLLAAKGQAGSLEAIAQLAPVEYEHRVTEVAYPEDIFKLNDQELRTDFALLTQGRKSAHISQSNVVLGNDFFAEEGVQVECCTFNTHTGPIYLGKDSLVMEGSMIRGPFALCERSVVKLGTKVYGATTVGPFSTIGGEVNNSVLMGFSNKGHDGFLGNSVLGHWCNIGADSNNSNLKNNYAEVALWHYPSQHFRKTGLQFCGLIMADHAKCGINTMFNTGTVVGVSANVFGAGFPRNFIPDFAWGSVHGYQVYTLKKMFETAERVMQRRNQELTEVDKDILAEVFEQTQSYRHF